MSEFTTKPLNRGDREDWRPLFEGYAEFYGVAVDDDIVDTVWNWLLDPEHVLEGLLTRDASGRAIGLIHIRACPRPLGGCDIGFLDDLFISPDIRGSGAADAMFESLRELARQRGWPAIRGITQHFNERARRLYDRYTGGPSDFIMYQWQLE